MIEILVLLAVSAGLGTLLLGSDSEEERDQEGSDTPEEDAPAGSTSSGREADIFQFLDVADTTDQTSAEQALDQDHDLDVVAGEPLQETEREAMNKVESDSRLVLGTQGSDNIVAAGHGQVIYHNDAVIAQETEHQNSSQAYSNYRDDSPDFIFAGSGDDSVFFGTGDQVTTGAGNDTLHLFLDSADNETVLHDFEQGKDRLVIYIPEDEVENIDVYEILDENGFTLEIDTANSIFALRFPNVMQQLNTEILSEEYDPETNPIIFIEKFASSNSSIFILSSTGYS